MDADIAVARTGMNRRATPTHPFQGWARDVCGSIEQSRLGRSVGLWAPHDCGRAGRPAAPSRCRRNWPEMIELRDGYGSSS